MEEQQKKQRPVSEDRSAKSRAHRYPDAAHRRRSADGTRNAAEQRRRPDGKSAPDRRRRPDGSPASERRHRIPDTAESAARRRSAGSRSASDQQRRRAPQSRSRRASSRRSTSAARRIPYLSSIIFAIILVIYVIIFVIVIQALVKRSKTYLAEREASQPQYKIEEYISNLTDGLYADMVKQASAGLQLSEYEAPDMLDDELKVSVDDSAKYSWQKAADYSNTRPNYYILRNGEAIATVALERSGWTEHYSLPLWQVGAPVSVMNISAKPAYTAVITAPSDAKVTINGIEIEENLFTETDAELKLTPTELGYANQPSAKTCEITGLFLSPKIEAIDSAGRTLTAETEPDPNAARQEFVFPHADEPNPDEALLDRIDKLTHAYMDYVINTHCTVEVNLANLSNYMLPGSDFANLMNRISGDVWYNNDPNMREDHVIEVQHLRKYSDNLCTADVHIESTIGKVAVNDYIVTIRFVLVNNGFGWYCSGFELFP
ncbi:MAG: hypothetical protein MJ065_05195 [Oscillospiraceae bacterium]|nr:hypothetical protein [Oscillospiraceae bacterium]